ncbi:Pentatricopeptide repeat-containing protein [Melia azedarach]|uniref:Pentatricopeptide repeat-containing protein n=1 Tax=Melia azedarach TaxID=155640 RepID=A0ACC1X2W2_MELAZ|nr:Pentatricopeptide repeat-containing protein [Melia azedarach]
MASFVPVSPAPSTAAPPPPQSPHIHSSPATSLAPPISKLKTPTIRSRLSKICQEGQPHLARQLFDTITRPTTVLWNTIIIGFICNNFPHEAILLYAQMRKSSDYNKCDHYTYSSVLKACAETRNLRIGKAVHCHFIRCLSNPSRIVYNSLLNMYTACLSSVDGEMGSCKYFEIDYSRYDLVRKVFDTMRRRNVVAWNTMVSWYVKTERYLEAGRQFRMMIELGIRPSTVTFVNVFPAFSSLGDYKNANVLYGLLVKSGSKYVNDLFVMSSAIFMYAELGCVDFARKIFDSCLERNTEVWNTMISGYVQNNCYVEAIELFIQAIESDEIVLDDVTFLSALSAVSQLQQLDLGRQLHAYIIKNLAALPIIVLNAVIVMYSRCNCIHTSFKVFEKMQDRDVVSWNTMISAFVQNGLDDEGLMLVYEMQKQGFMIDSVTVTALLSAASNLRNQDVGKQTHAYLLRYGIQFEGMESYLIDMYAKSGLIRTSQHIFEENHTGDRDQATWNAMIAGYNQNGLIEEAFVAFRQMLEQNVTPNVVTIASVLPACNPIGNIELGKQLHGFSIRHFLDINVYVGTALVDMYSKSGVVNYAEKVFAKIPEKNSVTYTAMIVGYGQHGMSDRALSLFHSMKGCGVEPDAITFVAVLTACSYAGLVDEGLQIFDLMKREYKIRPSTEHYCCVADMLGRVGRVVEAYEFVKELGDEGNVMEIWGSLLSACRLHGQSELGEFVAKKLLEMDTTNRTSGYRVLLSNIYAEEGNWENVDKVRKEMKEKGLRKEIGRSWIEIGGNVNHFVSKDQEHLQSYEIYEMLEGLALDMKDSCYKARQKSNLDAISKFDE